RLASWLLLLRFAIGTRGGWPANIGELAGIVLGAVVGRLHHVGDDIGKTPLIAGEIGKLLLLRFGSRGAGLLPLSQRQRAAVELLLDCLEQFQFGERMPMDLLPWFAPFATIVAAIFSAALFGGLAGRIARCVVFERRLDLLDPCERIRFGLHRFVANVATA